MLDRWLAVCSLAEKNVTTDERRSELRLSRMLFRGPGAASNPRLPPPPTAPALPDPVPAVGGGEGVAVPVVPRATGRLPRRPADAGGAGAGPPVLRL